MSQNINPDEIVSLQEFYQFAKKILQLKHGITLLVLLILKQPLKKIDIH